MSAVLRHVAKYRPNWRVDYQAQEGQHQVGRGIVANTFAYGSPHPSDHYDAEVQICLYDTFANWGDRPNTRVSSALHECFGLPWDAECGQYRVDVSEEADAQAEALLEVLERRPRIRSRVVALHYFGDSSPDKKNLKTSQASTICESIKTLGGVPLLLDYRNQSVLRNAYPTTGGGEYSMRWGRSAENQCAVISRCRAFVGIDSGPSKCASATDTPSLVIWTGHHPAPFHDPAPNTMHLVPHGYHGLEPVCNDCSVIDWFEKHYNVRMYDGDPVVEVGKWLQETIK